IGISALTLSQRSVTVCANFSSLRARLTCSSTKLLCLSTASTTAPSLLIAFLPHSCHPERSRGICNHKNQRCLDFARHDKKLLTCSQLTRTIHPRQDRDGVSQPWPRFPVCACSASIAARFRITLPWPAPDRFCSPPQCLRRRA